MIITAHELNTLKIVVTELGKYGVNAFTVGVLSGMISSAKVEG